MSGYVLCREGDDALAAFDHAAVRFAASLSDESGIIAFDGPALPWMERGIGTVFVEQDILHPWIIVAPKRRVGTGREVFGLVPKEYGDYLDQQEAVTGIAQVTDELLLVESDGPVAYNAGWSAAVVEYRDKRLEYANA